MWQEVGGACTRGHGGVVGMCERCHVRLRPRVCVPCHASVRVFTKHVSRQVWWVHGWMYRGGEHRVWRRESSVCGWRICRCVHPCGCVRV